jgi:hypothetical protein
VIHQQDIYPEVASVSVAAPHTRNVIARGYQKSKQAAKALRHLVGVISSEKSFALGYAVIKQTDTRA